MRCVSLTDIRFWRELKIEAAETSRIHLGRSSAGISTRKKYLTKDLHEDIAMLWKGWVVPAVKGVIDYSGFVSQRRGEFR